MEREDVAGFVLGPKRVFVSIVPSSFTPDEVRVACKFLLEVADKAEKLPTLVVPDDKTVQEIRRTDRRAS